MPEATVADRETAVRCTAVSRSFGHTKAVVDVDLSVRRGEIHALVGANGAGKSTLLGMLSGRIAPSDGDLQIFGRKLQGGRPRESRAASIAIVYQELTIVPLLSAAANVFLGEELGHGGAIEERRMQRRFAELCREFEVEIDGTTVAGELTVATQQLLEIMRAVQRQTKLLLLDEPTASLSHRERDFLLGLMRRLRDDGVTIIFVSHNLDEVIAVSDTVTVMRNARKIETAPVGRWTKSDLVEAMTGEAPARVSRERRAPRGEVVLEASDVSLPGALVDISLDVRAGEVLGLAGLVGSGRTSLLRSLAGLEPASSGTLKIRGKDRPWPRSPRQALRKLDIALLPEDRKGQGLVLGMSVPDNVTMTDLGTVSRGGLVNDRAQLAKARALMEPFRLNRKVDRYPVSELSGGGQQKVVLAKYLNQNPSVMLVDEPTRGIDVAAKVEVLNAVREFAQRGKAVILTSSEIEEVLDVSDRILVIVAGRVGGEFEMDSESPGVRDVLDLAFELDDPTAPVTSRSAEES
ncbi:MAG: sugar ABC transporter ATP-binding protein [Actinobacteria bacterium]|nr:sugar ABC transporter ATP-binding protein [Actinomycetota bacterium]